MTDDQIFQGQAATNFLYYTDLHYIDPKKKMNPLWGSACLLFVKRNSEQLLDDTTANKFRNIDNGQINSADYKKVFDPIDSATGTGGKAEHIATNWLANPIYVHINNIVEANLEKIPINLYCRAVDEYAMLKQQKENHRILGRKEFTNFINEFNSKLGFPKLNKGEDPFRYADNMALVRNQPKTGLKPKNMPLSMIDSLKAAIDDNEDLALFNEFIYKGDCEIAIELGQKHYLQKNRFARTYERLIADIRNFNRGCGRWYTSLTTGRPIISYMDGTKVFTSKFAESDGGDLIHWYTEYDISFGDFVKMLGKNRTKEELEKIFEQNKLHQASHGLTWSDCTSFQRNAAKIRIGYCEVQSQDCQVYAEGQRYGNLRFKEKPFDWYPAKNTPKDFKDKRVERHYNVWYKFYYVPITRTDMGRGFMEGDYIEQAKYIYDLGKLQDQQRYGDDDRNCHSSLVVWKRDGMSFGEIMNRYMPKIHLEWMKYDNYSSQNEEYVIFSNRLLENMMNLMDEGDKKAADATKMDFLKMLMQTGKGISDFTDEKGNQLDPVKHFSTGQGAAALRCLERIKVLYDQLTTALAISDAREGVDPKPRQSLGGIRLSLDASNNGTYFIEKGCIDMVVQFGNRLLYYMRQIVQEGDSERLQEFRDVVGKANGMAMEAIKDIPDHSLGLYVDNVNTDQQKQYLVGMATEMVKAGKLDVEALNLIIKVDNYKYAAVLMIMKYKQKQRKLMEDDERKQGYIMQQKNMDLQIKKQEYISKEEAKTISIDREKQWDMKIKEMEARLRSNNQAMIKDMISNNRMNEQTHKSDLEDKKKIA